MVKVEDRGRVRLITFSRPEALNAFTHEMYGAAQRALADASDDGGVAVAMITGEGRAFCAGQDLGEMRAAGSRRGRDGDGMPHGFGTFMETLMAFAKPLVAAVNGVGVGLGVTLLCHCDLVLIAEGARLRAPFTSLGVAPEAGSSFLLPSLMGWQAAAYFLLTSEWLSAQEAVATGLAWKSVPPESLLDEALGVASNIAAMPISSLVATKSLMVAARGDAVRAARNREDVEFARLTGGPANAEAIAAFMEKRPADFTKLGD